MRPWLRVIFAVVATSLGSAATAQADDTGSITYTPTFQLSGGSAISCTVTISHDQSIPDPLDNIMYYSGQDSCSSGVAQQATAEYWGWDGAVVYFPEWGSAQTCSTGSSGTSCASSGQYNNPATNAPGTHKSVIYDWYLDAPPGQTWQYTGTSGEQFCSGFGSSVIECLLPHDWIIPLTSLP
jgi:hypothetical protein